VGVQSCMFFMRGGMWIVVAPFLCGREPGVKVTGWMYGSVGDMMDVCCLR